MQEGEEKEEKHKEREASAMVGSTSSEIPVQRKRWKWKNLKRVKNLRMENGQRTEGRRKGESFEGHKGHVVYRETFQSKTRPSPPSLTGISLLHVLEFCSLSILNHFF